jgi:hypothetical protein
MKAENENQQEEQTPQTSGKEYKEGINQGYDLSYDDTEEIDNGDLEKNESRYQQYVRYPERRIGATHREGLLRKYL